MVHCLNERGHVTREELLQEASKGRGEARSVLKFIDGIEGFAFFDDLRQIMSQRGHDIDALLASGQCTEIIHGLLDPDGLNYVNMPKGLIKFHRYPEGNRTPFEEHLVEASSYLKSPRGVCSLHFTVSEGHLELFEDLLAKVRRRYERAYATEFRVSFSLQSSSTDTIAVDAAGKPFRDGGGKLLFRPGGHGALITNLNELDADVVFVKNIDNVAPDYLRGPTVKWKKVLCGYLIEIRRTLFGFIERLSSGEGSESFLREVEDFSNETLNLRLSTAQREAAAEEKRMALLQALNRPIRVCGMVENRGEPGGGPFWVENEHAELSAQIVERAQVDSSFHDVLELFIS
jgi:hypothetical protein